MNASTVIVILLAIGIMGFLFWAARKEKKMLISAGLIIDRPHTFYQKAEEFTLAVDDPALMTEKIKNLPYDKMAVTMKGNAEQQVFAFTGPYFEAEFYLDHKAEGNVVYIFSFTKWTSSNGIPKGLNQMNALLTSIEKAMISIDPNTKVHTNQIKTKTKLF